MCVRVRAIRDMNERYVPLCLSLPPFHFLSCERRICVRSPLAWGRIGDRGMSPPADVSSISQRGLMGLRRGFLGRPAALSRCHNIKIYKLVILDLEKYVGKAKPTVIFK